MHTYFTTKNTKLTDVYIYIFIFFSDNSPIYCKNFQCKNFYEIMSLCILSVSLLWPEIILQKRKFSFNFPNAAIDLAPLCRVKMLRSMHKLRMDSGCCSGKKRCGVSLCCVFIYNSTM